jgi:hypothetical protein
MPEDSLRNLSRKYFCLIFRYLRRNCRQNLILAPLDRNNVPLWYGGKNPALNAAGQIKFYLICPVPVSAIFFVAV